MKSESDAGAVQPHGDTPDEAAAERLREAERRGTRLSIATRTEGLGELLAWLKALPEITHMPAARAEVVATAVYEACANVIEHGCDNDPEQTLDVWWVPGTQVGDALGSSYFLIRDRGRPFTDSNWHESDFGDDRVRRRGRGFGLDIIHRATHRLAFHPGSPAGNLTLLDFHTDAPTRLAKEAGR